MLHRRGPPSYEAEAWTEQDHAEIQEEVRTNAARRTPTLPPMEEGEIYDKNWDLNHLPPYKKKGSLAVKKPSSSQKDTTSQEPSKPLPKNKQEQFSLPRPLTPSEKKALREGSRRSFQIGEGQFEDLA